MGDTRRKHRKYSRPRNLFDKERIEQENELIKKYGLKNKREIWKAKSEISKIRKRAKALIKADASTQQQFFEKLTNMGMSVTSIADALALTEEDFLKRRLQTIVFEKGLARTPKHARQLIAHRKILVEGRIVDVPSFLITRDLEGEISIVEPKKSEVLNKEEDNVAEENTEEEQAAAEDEANEETQTEENKSEEVENGEGQ